MHGHSAETSKVNQIVLISKVRAVQETAKQSATEDLDVGTDAGTDAGSIVPPIDLVPQDNHNQTCGIQAEIKQILETEPVLKQSAARSTSSLEKSDAESDVMQDNSMTTSEGLPPGKESESHSFTIKNGQTKRENKNGK